MSTLDFSVQSLFNVKGKIALVTGGGSGIGKTIASALVQNGAKVYIAARKESQLKEAVAELNAKGPGSADYIVANVSSKAGTDALISALEAREPAKKLHILVNNSGTSWGSAFDNFPEEKGWDNVMAVNVKSLFYLTSGLSAWLAKDASALDPGRVINISSVASVTPHAESMVSADGQGTWSYNVSKAAVNHLTSILAVKLGPQKITVNAICPGIFPTKMTAFGFKNAGEAKIVAAQPTGRVGQPSDLAGLALFLTSPASAHVTGAHILLDGGATLSKQGIAPRVKL
ncbi:NAD(P)-binding protein [Rhizopogon vinicolor AM-OR11-026]|uniref:NAD(P)-binding protein n=1 Tax=Rhizopogon vinicolor AM-OR11-026 TaxID=1314800 RepID=A0A1B7MVV8_9AGAM|nr:NAD(P)-binding protein [Rhizopogon vinicolor AM-OR11-026]